MGVLDNVIEGAATGATAGAPTGIGLPIGAIIGAGAGLIGGFINQHQQSAATQQQLKNQETLATYQQGLQEQTWHDTSYPEQVKMEQEAGLNPALLYSGGAGPGGTTGAGISTSIDRTPTTDFGQRVLSGAAAGNEAELQKTQEVKIAGADTKNTEQNTAKQAAEIPKLQAEATGQNINNQIQQIQANISTDMEPTMRQQIAANLQKTAEEVSNLEVSGANMGIDNHIKQATQQTVIDKYNAELNNLIADTIQKTAQTNLSNVDARRMATEIDQKWKDINLHQTTVGLEHGDRLKMMTTILEAAGISAAGNVANTILGIQKAKLPSVQTRTQGFDAQGNPATVIQNNVKQ